VQEDASVGLLVSNGDNDAGPPVAPRRVVAVVEDEPAAAELAAALCDGVGADAELYASPLPFLRSIQERDAPSAMVLDWRLEQELSAALFMAIRHRFPELPVVYWTGADPVDLPSMIRDDPLTRIVEKAGGADAFERALRWALKEETDG
jgi:FixJ family two-component response regulator